VVALADEKKQERELEVLQKETGKDPQEIIRGTKQCFLLYHMDRFAQAHRYFLWELTPGEVRDEKDRKIIMQPGYYSNTEDKPKIYLASESPEAKGSEFINRLSAKPGSTSLSEITNHDYSHLSPYFRLFKVHRRQNEATPVKIVEFKFDNKTRLDGISEKLTVQHPNFTESMYAKGIASGVKSFDWEFLGTDPFTATRDISAVLTLSFQHFSALLEVRDGLDALTGKTEKYKYLDLIVQPNCRESGETYGQIYAPECYEIRVDVGYYDPKSGLSSEMRKDLVKQRESMYLTVVEHSFNFAQDGTFELVIKYKGRLEALMRDKKFNVLLPAGGFIDLKQIDEIDKKINRLRESVKGKEQTEKEKEELAKLQEGKEQAFLLIKQVMYNGILERLDEAGMVYSYNLERKVFNNFFNWASKGEPTSVGGGSKYAPESVNIDLNEITNSGDIEGSLISGGFDQDVLDKNIKEVQEAIAIELDRVNEVPINFIYLGDLIATVMESVLGERTYYGGVGAQVDRPGFEAVNGLLRTLGILGDLEGEVESEQRILEDVQDIPESIKEIVKRFRMVLGILSYRMKGSLITKNINLAHIPISLETFSEFMIDNILSKEKTYYSFFAFLDDLLSDTVINFLGRDCFEGLIKIDSNLRARTKLFMSPNLIEETSFWSSEDFMYNTVDLHRVTSDNSLFFSQEQLNEDKDAGKMVLPYEYLVVTMEEQTPGNLHGIYEDDVKKGILHFRFGADRGLLKSVELNKTDQEYLPEARYAAEGAFVFNQLSNVYDANFKMLGNTLFSPGQHIYFDPTSLGAGEPFHYKKLSGGKIERSWANLMGLGGYHIITEIASSISPGKYTTTVKARYESGGSLPEDGT
jgi:hypothetical protein